MYCSECGKQILDDSKFCSFCGSMVYGSYSNDKQHVSEVSFESQKRLEQSVRNGTCIYLHDILCMELSINKLEQALGLAKNPIILHDYWYFWKSYRLQFPIYNHVYQDQWQVYPNLFLSYSYSQNEFYFSLKEDSDLRNLSLYDRYGNLVPYPEGNPVNTAHGNGCGIVLTQEVRDKLFTLPTFKKKMFSKDLILTNEEAIFWDRRSVYENNCRVEVFSQFLPIIEEFENSVRQNVSEYQRDYPKYMEKICEIECEIEKARSILTNLYEVNLIPKKFRNLGCIYFIYDFYSSSNTSLESVFLHLDLDKIQEQIQTVISNQRDSILQQAIIITQNEEILSQNQKLLNKLSDLHGELTSANRKLTDIQESSSDTAKWARIAAANTEACAWIGVANYIK